jgi:hypothetical protein
VSLLEASLLEASLIEASLFEASLRIWPANGREKGGGEVHPDPEISDLFLSLHVN